MAKHHAIRYGPLGRVRWALAALLAALLILGGPVGSMAQVGPADPLPAGPQPDDALVRFVNASPDAGHVDIDVDGTTALRALPFGGYSDLIAVPPGAHRIGIRSADGDPLGVAVRGLPAEPGRVYEVAAVGRRADASLDARVYPVDLRRLGGRQARVRLVHAATDVAALDLGTTGGTTDRDLFVEVGFLRASRYEVVTEGTYDLRLVGTDPAADPGSPKLLATQPGTTVDRGRAYSFFAAGRADDGTVRFVTVPTPVDAERRAALVAGRCEDPEAKVLYPLIGFPTPDEPAARVPGQAETSVTRIGVRVDDILGVTTSLVVERVDERGPVRVACGVVGGVQAAPDGSLAVGLHEEDGSGEVGVVYLTPDGDGTVVSVFLGEDLAGRPGGGPTTPARPVRAVVYAGTCDDLADRPTAVLGEVALPSGARVGEPDAATVKVGSATLPLALDDLAGGDHVLVLERGVGDRTVLACGEIVGVRRGDGALVVALRERDGSGVVGFICLRPAADGRTSASVFVGEGRPYRAGGDRPVPTNRDDDPGSSPSSEGPDGASGEAADAGGAGAGAGSSGGQSAGSGGTADGAPPATDEAAGSAPPGGGSGTDAGTSPGGGGPGEAPPPDAPFDAAPVEVPPVDAPPVDVSGAPETVDLSGVPAAEEANVPAEVGTAEPAQLPEQAGGEGAGPPSEVPAEPAAETGQCAAEARGQDAAGCHGD